MGPAVRDGLKVGAVLGCLAALVALVACAKDPISVNETDNAGFRVSLLFTTDGCKVYRFRDGGYYRYFVNCGSRGSRTEFDDVEARYNAATKLTEYDHFPQTIETVQP